jgi:hypothetical protein
VATERCEDEVCVDACDDIAGPVVVAPSVVARGSTIEVTVLAPDEPVAWDLHATYGGLSWSAAASLDPAWQFTVAVGSDRANLMVDAAHERCIFEDAHIFDVVDPVTTSVTVTPLRGAEVRVDARATRMGGQPFASDALRFGCRACQVTSGAASAADRLVVTTDASGNASATMTGSTCAELAGTPALEVWAEALLDNLGAPGAAVRTTVTSGVATAPCDTTALCRDMRPGDRTSDGRKYCAVCGPCAAAVVGCDLDAHCVAPATCQGGMCR